MPQKITSKALLKSEKGKLGMVFQINFVVAIAKIQEFNFVVFIIKNINSYFNNNYYAIIQQNSLIFSPSLRRNKIDNYYRLII